MSTLALTVEIDYTIASICKNNHITGGTMLVQKSKQFMRKSFESTMYTFQERPRADLDGNFGVYVHVPFCRSLCNFCPFYKIRFQPALKDAYLQAMLAEIEQTRMRGKARWMYMGGGTPNVLSAQEIGQIITAIRAKCELDSIGMELLPALADRDYLQGLHEAGVNKLSIGVESLTDSVLHSTGRKNAKAQHIHQLVQDALALEMWVNLDLMVGLEHQDATAFLNDLRMAAEMRPAQITIYPFMIIRGLQATPSMPDDDQFDLIDQAAEILAAQGFSRAGIWTFTRREELGDTVYDSSRDELVQDYIGFGPAAFSTYDQWKIVNPDLYSYLQSGKEDQPRMAFVAPKDKTTDDWRHFAAMLYEMQLHPQPQAPGFIRAYIRLLLLSGFGKHGALTQKGIHLAHTLTKTVVESLPFPVQNAACVANFEQYAAYAQSAEAHNP